MATYRRLFGYVRPYRARLLWSILCGALLSGTTALVALMVKPVLDKIFVDRDTTSTVSKPSFTYVQWSQEVTLFPVIEACKFVAL
jgi:ABC-type multidrug transport system fused ATPase/permease subunit